MISATYHCLGDLQIRLDCYLPGYAAKTLCPVFWFHGGGLCVGSRRDALWPQWLEDAARDRDWLLISADYPLLVPHTISDIAQSLGALLDFVASPSGLVDHLPEGIFIDCSRAALAGLSAGAWCARLVALQRHPAYRFRALCSVFGTGGKVLSDHYLMPRTTGFPLFGGQLTRLDRVRHLLDDPATATPVSEDPYELKPELSDVLGRGDLCYWTMEQGEYLDLVAGCKGLSATLRASADRRAAVPADLRPYFPELRAAELPPSILIHGELDSLALCEESEATYCSLKATGVDTELVIVPGAEHGLTIGGAPAPGLEKVWQQTVAFLARHLQAA